MDYSAKSVTLTEKDAGITLRVPMYKPVYIRLPGRSEADYVWAYEEPSAKVHKDAKDYGRDSIGTPHFTIERYCEKPDGTHYRCGNPPMGGNGMFVFVVRARESGFYALKFVYVRPSFPEKKVKVFKVKLNLHP